MSEPRSRTTAGPERAREASSPKMDHPRRWMAKQSELLWRSWDRDEFAVYHCKSGDTHLLNQAGAEALRSLERDTLSALELSDQVAQALGCQPDEDFRRHIANLLAEFDEVGLIEPIL